MSGLCSSQEQCLESPSLTDACPKQFPLLQSLNITFSARTFLTTLFNLATLSPSPPLLQNFLFPYNHLAVHPASCLTPSSLCLEVTLSPRPSAAAVSECSTSTYTLLLCLPLLLSNKLHHYVCVSITRKLREDRRCQCLLHPSIPNAQNLVLKGFSINTC